MTTLAVTTPWHPTVQRPFAGSFVQTTTAAVTGLFDRIDLYGTEDWTGPADPVAARAVRKAYSALTTGPGRRVSFRPRLTPEGYWATDIPVPVTPRRDYADWAQSHESALRAVLPDGFTADVVHGHVGIYGGWLALRFARPDARVVVTEHASFLGKILRQPRSRALYAQVIERADAFLAVSRVLRDQLAAEFPAHAGKLHIAPNAVDIASMPVRPEPVKALNRWLYVGNMAAAKGVPEVVEAFAIAAADEPELRLTLLGSGNLVEPLRARVREHGLEGRVAFHDAVPPQRVFGFLHAHDLLVHASKSETFGMTTVEAVGSGMPVLVTRCGGPQETLAGLDGVAGRLIDVSDDPNVIVAGYRALAERADRLDAHRARADLLARGVDVGLVTVEAGAWEQAGLDPRVRVYLLGDGERRHPLARLGRLLRRVHKSLDAKFYSKVYRLLRPYVMWRVARRSVLRQIEWTGVQQLVIGDSHAIPIGWHLARRHPGLPVGFELDRTPFAPTTEPSGIDVIDA